MYRSTKASLVCATAAAVTSFLVAPADAQSAKPETTPLPPVIVEQSAVPEPAKKAKKRSAKTKPVAPAAISEPATPAASAASGVAAARSGSLSVPNTAEARAEIDQTPGGVELVPAEAYRASTPSATIKDALDYVPGVFVQPKWGEDSRLSIRGSSLSRNFH